jgi:hypothetical protein
MNLQPIKVQDGQRHFTTFCISCSHVISSSDKGVMVDRDGCPLRSYYCALCASLVTPEQAKVLDYQAHKLVHSNA